MFFFEKAIIINKNITLRTIMAIITAKDFGRWVKIARKRNRLTQIELAAASGVGVRFVRELEKGKPSCQLDKALLVAGMLGIKLEASLPPPLEES